MRGGCRGGSLPLVPTQPRRSNPVARQVALAVAHVHAHTRQEPAHDREAAKPAGRPWGPSIVPRAAAVALLALSLAACGGGSSSRTTTQSAAARAAEQRWATGLREWGAGMRGAIDGLSFLFSHPSAVQQIEAGEARTSAKLRRYERVLAACSVRVHRLGAPPGGFRIAQHEALNACRSLERAAALIRRGVTNFQSGLGPDLLNASAAPLANGEDGVRRAQLDLAPQPS